MSARPKYRVPLITALASLIVLTVVGFAFVMSGDGTADANDPGTRARERPGDELLRVQTVTVEKRDLARTIELPGTVEGFETADLFAKVGGYLEEISVDIGDRVAEGQVLARLWIPEMHKELEEERAAVASAEANAQQAQAGIRQAEAELRSAEARVEETKTQLQERQAQLDKQLAEYERTERLVQSGSLQAKLLDEAKYGREAAQAALETVQAKIRTAQAQREAAAAYVQRAVTDQKSAEAKVDLAKAKLAKVQTMLEYGEIRAPFDGVVTKRFFDRGAFIQPAEGNSAARPLLNVTSSDVVRIFLDLPMAEVRWLNRGDKAVLDRINVLPDERFEGEVTRFASSLDRSSRMMRVEIDLSNPDGRLLPGYYGYVTLSLDEFPETPVIPSSALMAEGNLKFVYVIDGDVCRKRAVTANFQDGVIVGIGSGLNGGEQIVQAGAGQLAEGQKVFPVSARTGD